MKLRLLVTVVTYFTLLMQSTNVQAISVGQLFIGSSVAGDTSLGTDDYNLNVSYSSKDDEWLLTLNATGNIVIELRPLDGLDLALFLFSDFADPMGSLIDSSDSAGFGSDESITYNNTSAPSSFGLVVDGFGNNNSGRYLLRVYAEGTTPPAYVPIPAAVWLFGSGLLGLIGISRRKKTT